MACYLLAWAAAPAWCEDQNQPAAQEAAATPAAPANADAPVAPGQPPVSATPSTAVGVEIKEAVVCQDVVDRAPVGSADVFSKDLPKVYCYCRVIGMQGEGAIVHNWYYQGALKSSIKLPVRAANWRTWSYKAMSPGQAGEWMVEIVTESGTPLESVVFMVQ
ncbi:MAG: DUF2914 domain-containing protein [Desulfobacterales bacterium]|nr:DUF2914 domain-containing protein [Desulfobacterales bacterium]